MEKSSLKRTPLFELYKEYGAKTVNFGGWELPVHFSSIKEEHEAVRTKAGLFDVSHMGEIIVKGKDSLAFLQKMMTNDVSQLQVGDIQYTAMCNGNGGTIDDLLIYKLAQGEYLLVVNASNMEKDDQWLRDHIEGEVELENVSEQIALLALQGPLSSAVLKKLLDNHSLLTEFVPFTFQNEVSLFHKKVLISRTGYTGEDGFEIYCHRDDAVALWKAILVNGEAFGIRSCGLGARDTLRFEAKLPLYGQELTPHISPLEAGIGFAVKIHKKEDFIGKKALIEQKQNGVPRKLVGIEMKERGIPRHGYPVFDGDEQIGVVTTGTQSPTLNKSVGLALLKTEYAELHREVQVEIRSKRLKAEIVSTPFYKRTLRGKER